MLLNSLIKKGNRLQLLSPLSALGNWTTATTADTEQEDGKGVLQKNSGEEGLEDPFKTALDSSREHPLVARAADRVWAPALPSVMD